MGQGWSSLIISQVSQLQIMWKEFNGLIFEYNEMLNIKNLSLNNNELFKLAVNDSLNTIQSWLENNLQKFKDIICAFARNVNSLIPSMNLPSELPERMKESTMFDKLSQ